MEVMNRPARQAATSRAPDQRWSAYPSRRRARWLRRFVCVISVSLRCASLKQRLAVGIDLVAMGEALGVKAGVAGTDEIYLLKRLEGAQKIA